jgi:hypothetical protein
MIDDCHDEVSAFGVGMMRARSNHGDVTAIRRLCDCDNRVARALVTGRIILAIAELFES